MPERLRFHVGGHIMRMTDVAYLDEGDELRDALVETVIQDIATDIEVTVSGVEMHLAAWIDPDHWADDWREKGIDVDNGEVEGLLAEAVEQWSLEEEAAKEKARQEKVAAKKAAASAESAMGDE